MERNCNECGHFMEIASNTGFDGICGNRENGAISVRYTYKCKKFIPKLIGAQYATTAD